MLIPLLRFRHIRQFAAFRFSIYEPECKQSDHFQTIGFLPTLNFEYPNRRFLTEFKNRGFPFPEKTRYNPTFEYMFVLSKGKPKSINLIKDKKNKYSGDKVARANSDRQTDGTLKPNSAYKIAKDRVVQEYGNRDNVWKYAIGYGNTSRDKYAFEHPAMFPEALAKDHILSWSNKGDLVFDPFAGSGTTLKMAQLMGRNYLGFEIAEEYIPLINKRLMQKPIDHFLSYSSEADASSSAKAEILIGIKSNSEFCSQRLIK